jgi:beta-1,2-mannobiose phosphorylase / 1,2-beta-oligomannan phosphorylase
MKFKRNSVNPILTPNTQNIWESKYVFNPGVIYDGDIFHMLYRAQGPDMVSRFGYSVSKDGVNFNRMSNPVFEPEIADEVYGVEDPRITYLDGKYHICYTAFSPEKIKVGLAVTDNFIAWERKGILLENFEKDATLLPEKINGKYVLFFSLEPDMYLSFSEDLMNWEEPVKIASPRKGKWDNLAIGIGGVPIKTEQGWLVMYHGSSTGVKPIYHIGLMLLDLNNPSKVIKRTTKPILSPEKSWEIAGGVPHIVFSCAMIEVNGVLYLYYGGADSVIGLATLPKKDVMKWITG